MRHRKKTVKLGRTSAHRNELLSNLVCNLIKEGRIKTTIAKAKAARSLAEKMVTLAKKGSLSDRRKAIAKLKHKEVVKDLFDNLSLSFKDRQGGYTRITKLGKRISDSSEMVILEWVKEELAKEKISPVLEEKSD